MIDNTNSNVKIVVVAKREKKPDGPKYIQILKGSKYKMMGGQHFKY
jgi:hypothetical protein